MTQQQSTHLSSELQAFLEAEVRTLSALNTAIETEHGALTGDAVDALEIATRDKLQSVADHADQQSLRVNWMRENGFEDMPYQDLLDKIGGTAALEALQRSLATLAETCQNNNRRNGSLILRLQDRAQNALDILRGDEPGGDVYSLSGTRQHHSDGRSLGKA